LAPLAGLAAASDFFLWIVVFIVVIGAKSANHQGLRGLSVSAQLVAGHFYGSSLPCSWPTTIPFLAFDGLFLTQAKQN
jgi:hypothetical protein